MRSQNIRKGITFRYPPGNRVETAQCADFKNAPGAYSVIRARDEASYGVIRLGQRLVELKDSCQHGEFIKIAESCCGLTIQHCNNLMRIYREFGQNEHACSFSAIALLELSKADDPQAALAEAEKMESAVTAKHHQYESGSRRFTPLVEIYTDT